MNFERTDFKINGYDDVVFYVRIDFCLNEKDENCFTGISGFKEESAAKDFINSIMEGDYLEGTGVEFTKSYYLNNVAVKEETLTEIRFEGKDEKGFSKPVIKFQQVLTSPELERLSKEVNISVDDFIKQVRVDSEGNVTLKFSYDEFKKISWALESAQDYYAHKEFNEPDKKWGYTSEEFKELEEKLDEQVYISQPKALK